MSHEPRRPVRRAAGCVVYRYDGAGAPLVLLIHDKYGRWTLPKGHLKAGESEQAAAVREVREETGAGGELGPLVGRIAYVVMKNGVPHDKQVEFFLLHASSATATPQDEEGISAVDWFAPSQALALIGYPHVRDILVRALQMLPDAAPAGRSS